MSGGRDTQEILVTADGTSIPLSAHHVHESAGTDSSSTDNSGGIPDSQPLVFTDGNGTTMNNFTTVGDDEPMTDSSSMPPIVEIKGIDPAIYVILAFFFFIILFYFFYRNQQKKKQEREAFFRELDGDKVYP